MQKSIGEFNGKTVYNVKFDNLTDLYDYLKSNPEVNKRIFVSQASIENEQSFSGENLSKSIEYLIKGYKNNLDNFLVVNKNLNKTTKEFTENRTLERTMYGGFFQPALVAAGVPNCNFRYNRNSKKNVRNIYYNLAISGSETKNQIINRGIALLYIIESLEKAGELVNLKVFNLTQTDNEIINIEVLLKKPGELFLDTEKCQFPLTSIEMTRRIILRVMESIEVNEIYWSLNYGDYFWEDEIRKFFNVKDYDLVIASPHQMGIQGINIYDDTISLIKALHLEEYFNLNSIEELKKHEDERLQAEQLNKTVPKKVRIRTK